MRIPRLFREDDTGWLGKMYSKVLSGVGKIGISAAGNLLATTVKLYMGLDA